EAFSRSFTAIATWFRRPIILHSLHRSERFETAHENVRWSSAPSFHHGEQDFDNRLLAPGLVNGGSHRPLDGFLYHGKVATPLRRYRSKRPIYSVEHDVVHRPAVAVDGREPLEGQPPRAANASPPRQRQRDDRNAGNRQLAASFDRTFGV